MIQDAMSKSGSDHTEPATDMGKPRGVATAAFVPEPAMERRVILKMDILLMPVMSIIFVFMFLDRSNIGNARIAGLQKTLMVTYIPYVLNEIPSNLVLKKVGPRLLLPGLCMAWALVMSLHCQIKSFAGLMLCRFFLGMCEGGLVPGFVLYLSEFYQRHEVRIGCIYGAAAVAGAFSGLLAYAIEKFNGRDGLHGWQWIFLIEGVVTIGFAPLCFWILPNNPSQLITLHKSEVSYVTARLAADTLSNESPRITLKAVPSVFKEPHILLVAAMSFSNGIFINGLTYFTRSIVQALGYGVSKTQLLSVPPYALAFILTMTAAYIAHHYRRRGLTAMCTLSLAIIGCIVNLTCTSIGARYSAQCLNVASIYATGPSLLTWLPNNTATYGRHATAVAFGVLVNNAAGLAAIWLYPTRTAPRYLLATRINLGIICLKMAFNWAASAFSALHEQAEGG